MLVRSYQRAICGVLVFCMVLFTLPCSAFAETVDDGSSIVSPGEISSTDLNNPAEVPAEEVPAEPPPEPVFDTGMVFHSHVVLELKYIKADQAKTMFAALMPSNQIRVEAMNNMLIVMGNEEDLQQVKDILAEIDSPPRQVMFEAEIIEISRDDVKNIGINWGEDTALPEASSAIEGNVFRMKIGKTQYGVNFKATVNHLVQNKKGRLLASPRIAALNGQTAQIMIGDKLAVESKTTSDGNDYYSVSYIDVGIKLEVTPTVHADGTITTHIKPEVSNKTDQTVNNNPNIRTRQAETTLRVKDGETIVLGGLIQREETRDVVKTPILGDIPLVRHFFRSTNKEKKETELVILITPKMIEL